MKVNEIALKLIQRLRQDVIISVFLYPLSKQERLEGLKDALKSFDNIKSIDNETKQKMRMRILSNQDELNQATSKRLWISFLVLIIFLIATFSLLNFSAHFTTSTIVPFFIKRDINYKLHDNLTDIVTYVTLSAIFFPLLLWTLKAGLNSVQIGLIPLILFLIFIEAYIFEQIWDKEIHFIINGIAISILLSIETLTWLLFVFFTFNLVFYFIKYQTVSRHPLATIIKDIREMIISLESDKNKRNILKYKQKQILRLEEAAKCFDNYLLRRLRVGDIITDTWMKETFKQIAAALREKKKWILVPKADTDAYLLQSMTFTLICIVEDNWDALERAEPQKLSLPQLRNSIISFLSSILKATFLAVLPVVGVLIIQQTPLAFTGPFREYVMLGALIWALLTFVVTFDPNFSTKFSAIKDIASLVLPPKTDQKS